MAGGLDVGGAMTILGVAWAEASGDGDGGGGGGSGGGGGGGGDSKRAKAAGGGNITALPWFLVLDPHYTGEHTLEAVQRVGGCSWQLLRYWRDGVRRYFCLPAVEKLVAGPGEQTGGCGDDGVDRGGGWSFETVGSGFDGELTERIYYR